jgi:hypothetical protein
LKWTGTGILPAQMLKQSSPKKRTVEDNSRYYNSSPIHENNAQTTLNDCYYNLIISIMPENIIEE